MKATEIYQIAEKNFNDEKLARVGSQLPDIQFDKQNTLTKENLKKYKLTFIDYSSTTCEFCIRTMPKIAEMHKKYKDKGINFIDENQPEKIELAKSILS
jgi:thiol-disulfide isomerase/thioredoxin